MQKQKSDQRLHGNLKPLSSLLLMFFAKICSFLSSTIILISLTVFFTQLYHFSMRSSMMSSFLQLVLTPKRSACTISESLSLYQNLYYKHLFLHQEVNFESRHTHSPLNYWHLAHQIMTAKISKTVKQTNSFTSFNNSIF